MDKINILLPTLEQLPTGKAHISFSELRDWQECTYRHYLKHIKKINLDVESIPLIFGKAMHQACEGYLKNRTFDLEPSIEYLKKSFNDNKHIEIFTELELENAINDLINISKDIPIFLNTIYPNWEYITVEHLLYQKMLKYPYAFKGYIDGIIKIQNKRNQSNYWVIDWKTTGWGWDRAKKTNTITQQQLVFYKNFWTQELNVDFKSVRCAFILLKRKAKEGKHCEQLPISVGEITSKRVLQVLNNATMSMKKGIFIKNKVNCKYCKYKGTEYCK